jgi:hypothetical protein
MSKIAAIPEPAANETSRPVSFETAKSNAQLAVALFAGFLQRGTVHRRNRQLCNHDSATGPFTGFAIVREPWGIEVISWFKISGYD